jgi:hypothetical protein
VFDARVLTEHHLEAETLKMRDGRLRRIERNERVGRAVKERRLGRLRLGKRRGESEE